MHDVTRPRLRPMIWKMTYHSKGQIMVHRKLSHETTILDVWSDIAGGLIDHSPDISPAMLHLLKRSFYSGAISMFCIIDKCADDDVDTQYHMGQRLAELNRFFEEERGIPS